MSPAPNGDAVVRIVLVDDMEPQRRSVEENLRLALVPLGCALEVVGKPFTTVEEAVAFMERAEAEFDVVVTDLLWPKEGAKKRPSGMMVIHHAKLLDPRPLIVALSTGDDDHRALMTDALEQGADIAKFHDIHLPGDRGDGWLLLAQEIVDRLAGRGAGRSDPTDGEGGRPPATKVFIGHGQSLQWMVLRDHLVKRGLDWIDFDRVSSAGRPHTQRLSEMLEVSMFAFLVLTAEDEREDGTMVARQNVVHEAGFFQGRLGFERAILLLEEGCADFKNVEGLGRIDFPKDNIRAAIADIDAVLEREGLI